MVHNGSFAAKPFCLIEQVADIWHHTLNANGKLCVSVKVSTGSAVVINAPQPHNGVNIQDWDRRQFNSFVGFFFLFFSNCATNIYTENKPEIFPLECENYVD